MALYEKGSGLLDTHVTWEDIEVNLQKALGTTATFGPNKTVKNIAAGRCFSSRISLINPDWQNGSDDLPKSFVAKISTPLASIEMNPGFHKTEKEMGEMLMKLFTITFNTEIFTFNILEKYGKGRIPFPKVFYSQKFSEENPNKGFLIMEYMDNLENLNLYDRMSVEDVKKVLKYLAVWESIGLEMTDDERSMFSNHPISDKLGDIMTPEMLTAISQGLIGLCGEKNKELVTKFLALTSKLCNKEYLVKLDEMGEKLGMKSVWSHGDLWSANILWTKEDDIFTIKGIIDFQTAAFCSPAMDLTRLFCANLSGKDRRENWEDLLKTFYGYLKEEVKGELPYTYEQLVENYKQFFPAGGFFLLPIVAPVFGYLTATSPQKLITAAPIIMEKVISIIEDVVQQLSE